MIKNELENNADFKAGQIVDGGKYRIETDPMGIVKVPAGRLWGAETQRSLIHFAIGDDRMPKAVYHAYGYVKKAAAIVNRDVRKLSPDKAELIIKAADEVIAGTLDDEFPLFVWQTGSGTQSNMNINEVIANRAIQMVEGIIGSKDPIHPNDHVNMSQSTNDTFQTAMHIATVLELANHLIPKVGMLADSMWRKAVEWVDIVKIGRTHLQDATPLTVGQEWSGYVVQIREALELVRGSMNGLHKLAAGGTAVGTGINSPPDFGPKIASEIAKMTGHPFITAPNKFAAQGSLDAMVAASAALRSLAVALLKIANDIRWLGCGPRAGFHELILPANEPGSSIMPGKVNPTQEEAVIMVCIQVIANDSAVAFAGTQGHFELNTMRPIIIKNVLHSGRILADVCDKFRIHSLEGIELDRGQIQKYVNQSLMLVTALSPVIGYDKAADIASEAYRKNTTLREAAISSGHITAEQFDKIVVPEKMVGNPRKDLGLTQ